jgi:DNA-binding phage protein
LKLALHKDEEPNLNKLLEIVQALGVKLPNESAA